MEKTQVTPWYKIQAKADDTAEISIFGDIGNSFWNDGISPETFKKDFDAIKDSKAIKVLINSPGGNVFDGITIYNIINDVREKVSVEVMGMAASAASIIALAGSTVTMRTGSFFMIHHARTFASGPAAELRKVADTLDTVSNELVNIYVKHSDLDAKAIKDYMDEEKWFTASEALESGFADEVDEQSEAAASVSVSFMAYGYQHIPAEIAAHAENDIEPPDNIRDHESALRDLGYSIKVAEKIAAVGFKTGTGEPDPEPAAGDPQPAAIETSPAVGPGETLKSIFADREMRLVKNRLATRGEK